MQFAGLTCVTPGPDATCSPEADGPERGGNTHADSIPKPRFYLGGRLIDLRHDIYMA